MSSTTIIQDGVPIVVDTSDARAPAPVPPPGPQTVFTPFVLMTTLFTPAEQVAFNAKPQGILFAELIAAEPTVDVTSPVFKGYVAQAVQGGFLTQARADQVLAGTPAPQGAS